MPHVSAARHFETVFCSEFQVCTNPGRDGMQGKLATNGRELLPEEVVVPVALGAALPDIMIVVAACGIDT